MPYGHYHFWGTSPCTEWGTGKDFFCVMRRALGRAIVLSVMEATSTCREQNSFYLARSEQKFVDTSTWEQLIRVLEESKKVNA